MAQVQVKQYKCFSCNEPITFNGSKQRLNLDGTVHICDESKKQQHRNSKEASENRESRRKEQQKRYWRWFWSHGTGANYKKYSNDEYKNRRKESRQKREEYKQRYYNESLGIDKALEILQIVKAEFLKLAKNERLTAVRTAYRKLALKFHPDRNKEPDASKRFIEATEAYELVQKELYNI